MVVQYLPCEYEYLRDRRSMRFSCYGYGRAVSVTCGFSTPIDAGASNNQKSEGRGLFAWRARPEVSGTVVNEFRASPYSLDEVR